MRVWMLPRPFSYRTMKTKAIVQKRLFSKEVCRPQKCAIVIARLTWFYSETEAMFILVPPLHKTKDEGFYSKSQRHLHRSTEGKWSSPEASSKRRAARWCYPFGKDG